MEIGGGVFGDCVFGDCVWRLA